LINFILLDYKKVYNKEIRNIFFMGDKLVVTVLSVRLLYKIHFDEITFEENIFLRKGKILFK